jgi:hypothetical protein
VPPDRRRQIVAAGERYLAEHGIEFEQVEFVAFESGPFDGLCYVHFPHRDTSGAIARALHVRLPHGSS